MFEGKVMIDENKPRALLTRRQVGAMLGVKPGQVTLLRKEDGLPFFQLLYSNKTTPFYSRASVKRWAKDRGMKVYPIPAPEDVEDMSVWQMLDSVEKDD